MGRGEVVSLHNWRPAGGALPDASPASTAPVRWQLAQPHQRLHPRASALGRITGAQPPAGAALSSPLFSRADLASWLHHRWFGLRGPRFGYGREAHCWNSYTRDCKPRRRRKGYSTLPCLDRLCPGSPENRSATLDEADSLHAPGVEPCMCHQPSCRLQRGARQMASPALWQLACTTQVRCSAYDDVTC